MSFSGLRGIALSLLLTAGYAAGVSATSVVEAAGVRPGGSGDADQAQRQDGERREAHGEYH